MRVVLKGWTSNPDYSTGCDYALVEIGEGFARLALRRIKVLGAQKALDPCLNESYYWDSSAQFFNPWVDCASESSDIQTSGVELEKTLDGLEVDSREVLIVPAECDVPESQIAAVECAQMIVHDGGVAFAALLRHTDIYVTTAEIPKQVIESATISTTA
jgi:hypothetical protein